LKNQQAATNNQPATTQPSANQAEKKPPTKETSPIENKKQDRPFEQKSSIKATP
jgi:hypothetical protein